MNRLLAVVFFISFVCVVPLSISVKITNVDDYNPGSCNQTKVLQVFAVKDKDDKKKLWICTEEGGKYLWKPVDGKTTVGEFLNPGYDCTDILNQEDDVMEGYYWINLGISKKRKVWCDMTTDGGGFMLVARKHDANTWDIPSKDEPVDPSSKEKFWTSQLGDAPIRDFRIQMSTSDSFDDTKAHWSYRLVQRRKLEDLMITDRGCDVNSPGIGDIALVKDLMSKKITRAFKCSVFGPNTSSFFKVGWSKMNECLKKPCNGSGYLRLSNQKPIKFQVNGAFSYSTSNSKSGVFNNATAYIGCSYGNCCGCFGPVGGTDNYCDTNCNAINGGTKIDSKNIYTWIWVRSSLPKRIWSRCMEYKDEDENGEMQWYKLLGNSVIPQKGRCSSQGDNNLRLNKGVVVVPNEAEAEKVPKIPGLLEFRQDQKKLYLRANNSWKILTQEDENTGKTLMNLENILDIKFNQLMTKIAAIDSKLNATYAELKNEIQTTDSELKGKISSVEAADVGLKGKLDTKFAELVKKIEAGDTELKAKLVFSTPNYNKIKRVCGGQYKWLNESDRRYSYSSYSGNSDYSLSGWYRFGGSAGTQMFSGCVQGGSSYCSTSYPGHLTGGHPGVNDGIVSRIVCFSYRSGSYDYCCYRSHRIKVLNCGVFYLYELNSAPGSSYRYCSNGN